MENSMKVIDSMRDPSNRQRCFAPEAGERLLQAHFPLQPSKFCLDLQSFFTKHLSEWLRK